MAVDSNYIYWAQGSVAGSAIGRANLDGTGVNPNFIPSSAGVDDPSGVAVTPTAIFWANRSPNTIGRANIDGSGANGNLIPLTADSLGLAADSSFVYWTDTTGNSIGRAALNGSGADSGFQAVGNVFAGVAVDPSFVYWGSDAGNTVGRAPIGGGAANQSFVATGTTGGGPSGVAVNSQYLFWGNYDTGAIGRSNVDGSSPNPALIAGAGVTGPGDPSQLAAVPSNKVTVNSVTRKKKKGTATINAKVPGPGQVTLSETGTEDVDATAAAVKPQGLTITAASSFKLAVKPTGKTNKTLKKQVKRKGKGKVGVKVFVGFVPAGVAGVPNSKPVKITLVRRVKKR